MAETSRSTIGLAVLTGLLALLAALVGAATKGYWDVKLGQQKFYSDLILRALQANSADERLASLRFMVSTNLITDADIKRALDSLLARGATDSTVIPQFRGQGIAFASPVIEDARVYLLTGSRQKRGMFEGIRADLAKAGFGVVGADYLVDRERPSEPEVRYFHAQDSVQAEGLASIMRLRLQGDSLAARQYHDEDARPGYLEIWLGR
jgi:hypothetical protein